MPLPIAINGLPQTGIINNFTRVNKFFELTNHLCNVVVTISDKKNLVFYNDNISYYNADVISANDYYPFGMQMPGRIYTAAGAEGYRYGFNGQEKSTEIFEGSTTALFWEYDSRIGRRWNVDPIIKHYESPYLCFSGNPIWFVDINGDDTTKGAFNVFIAAKKDKRDKALSSSFEEATKAAAKSNGNLVVVEVKNAADAYEQIAAIMKRHEGVQVSTMIFDSHGDYLNAHFDVGSQVFKSNNVNNSYLIKLSTLMSSSGEVVLLACHAAGNSINNGDLMSEKLSTVMNHPVWASKSWTGSYKMFGNGVNLSQPNPNRVDGNEQPEAWDKLGTWTNFKGNGNVSNYPNGISFTSNGNVSLNQVKVVAPVSKTSVGKSILRWIKKNFID